MKLLATLLLAASLSGCFGPQPRAPQGTLEQIEAAEIGAQNLSASITNLACTKFQLGKCIEPGKALDPDTATRYQGEVQEVRRTLRAAKGIGAGNVGQCMGLSRTSEQCLAAARQIFFELEKRVLEAQAQAQGAK